MCSACTLQYCFSLPTLFSLIFFFFLWAWEHVHQACRVTQQKQTLEIVRFCPCKWHGTNAFSGLKYVHPDRNLLLEVEKPPIDSSCSIGGCCGWECRARTAGFSSSRLQLCLLLDSQLWVDHTLVLACSFSSFHVFLAFSQDLWVGRFSFLPGK